MVTIDGPEHSPLTELPVAPLDQLYENGTLSPAMTTVAEPSQDASQDAFNTFGRLIIDSLGWVSVWDVNCEHPAETSSNSTKYVPELRADKFAFPELNRAPEKSYQL